MVTILAIEDEDAILDNILEILEMNGYEAYGAPDGPEGVQAAQQSQPDLILCDINMPKMDGYNVLMTLRNDPQTSQIPLVFLTAYADREFQRRGMTLGAEDYLTKPFTPQELLQTVQTQLDKTEERQREMNELRTNLIMSLPHELRTPLTGIVTCADLLMLDIEENAFDLHRAEQTIEIIQKSGKRLQRLIENHLVYSQIEIYAKDPKDRQTLTQGEGLDFPMQTVNASAYNTLVEMKREDDLIIEGEVRRTAKVSYDNLNRIVQELTQNAAKFSKPTQPIEISGWAEDHSFYLSIRDYGRGIKQENLARIGAFMQFQRDEYEQQGMGLGLTIARRLTEIHGGELAIESIVDEGTTVTLCFPLVD
jgi:two-component system sensor histidine kinase/response regulator